MDLNNKSVLITRETGSLGKALTKHIFEKYLGKKAIKEMLAMQDGDVKKTWASISKITKDYNFQNNVSLDEGIKEFISWFKVYHKV